MTEAAALAERVDFYRLDASRRLDAETRSALGQFLTPAPIARFMASLFDDCRGRVSLLDAGAGVGSLAAALVGEFCDREVRPEELRVTAVELDPLLVDYLKSALDDCQRCGELSGVLLRTEIRTVDFIALGSELLSQDLLRGRGEERFSHVIMNPPYKKIASSSQERRLLRSIGIEVSNLYAGFVAVAVKLLRPEGELVAIIPRSFCNGPYFRPFRELLLGETTIRRIHVFESRTRAFKDDEVLQENVIIHAMKNARASALGASGGNDQRHRRGAPSILPRSRRSDPESRRAALQPSLGFGGLTNRLNRRRGARERGGVASPKTSRMIEPRCVGKNRTVSTGRRWLSSLSAVYRYASQKGVAVQNPVRAFLPTVSGLENTKAGRAGAERTANPIETAEELAALDGACVELGDPDVYLLVLLMLEHGERRGEAFAARPIDMDLGRDRDDTGRLVWVRENRPMGLPAEAPKSGLHRAVPMSRRLRDHLRQHYAVFPRERPLMHRFTRSADYFQRTLFPRLCKRAGLQRRLPKDLRDTFASQLLSAGFPQVQIMRWMGHAPGSVSMFRKRYAKWIGGENEWSYRPPLQLEPGEVPSDVFGRLLQGCCQLQQGKERGDGSR